MRMLGTEPMGWQSLTLARGLEHEAGDFANRECDVSKPRQAGVSTLILALMVWRMLRRPGTWVTYTTASRLAGRRKMLKVWKPMVERSPFAGMFRFTKGTGSETIECVNDSLMVLLSSEDTSGHGDSIDLGILDEAWALTEAAEQAVRPAQAARPNAQLWPVSTAGTRRSVYWRDKVDSGRLAAKMGTTDGRCFTEWAAGPQVDVTDPTTWSTFHPALGRTISREFLAGELATMRKLSDWRRAYANQWPDELDEGGWAVIDEDTWRNAAVS